MEKKVVAVIDTSVYINNFMSTQKSSNCCKIWQALIEQNFTIASTKPILKELARILYRKDFDKKTIISILSTIREKGLYYEGNYQTNILDNIDPDDNMFLAACLESNADYLVSLDKKHLLPLKHFHGTQIVMPSGFLRAIKKEANNLNTEIQNVIINIMSKEIVQNLS